MKMREKLKQEKASSIDNPAWDLNESMAHILSESEPLVLKAGINTSWGTAPDHIHFFLRSNNVNYGGILTTVVKIIPIFVHVYTGNGRPGNTIQQLQQQTWQLHPERSWHPPQQLTLLNFDWLFRSVIRKLGY